MDNATTPLGGLEAASVALLGKALALGADLAGIASVNDLRNAGEALDADEVVWPEGAQSIVVIAVVHPPERPEMDWWFGRIDPPGNRVLAGIVQGLCDWVPGSLAFRATHLPYHVDRGGVYLKDAAVLAGLGCIGLNNLLVTPEYGPRVRLRALTLDVSLPPTGPADFDPCADCDAPCRRACPQGTFDQLPAGPHTGRLSQEGGRLAARTGHFSRSACYVQMDLDIGSATLADAAALADARRLGVPDLEGPVKVIRYCRACESSCLVGADAGAR